MNLDGPAPYERELALSRAEAIIKSERDPQAQLGLARTAEAIGTWRKRRNAGRIVGVRISGLGIDGGLRFSENTIAVAVEAFIAGVRQVESLK